MYRAVGRGSSYTIYNREGIPDITCTDEFLDLIKTLPNECPVPVAIIKLGFLTKHIEPTSDEIEVQLKNEDLDSVDEAVVPPQTLAAVRHLLYHFTDNLSSEEKKRVGKFCEKTNLNKPKELGAKKSAVIQATSNRDDWSPPFLVQKNTVEPDTDTNIQSKDTTTNQSQSTKHSCTHCGREYESAAGLRGHERKCLDKDQSDCDSSTQPKSKTKKSHKKSKKHQCSYCDKRFRKKKNKKFHQKKCDEKPTSRTTSDKSPFSGIKIKKNRGSERKTGRSPFSDSDLIKDTLVKGPNRKDK